MKLPIKTCLVFFLAILLLSCLNEHKIRAGSICSVKNGDGRFGVVKVLVIENEIIYVKIYKNEYEKRPSKINIKSLSIGSIYEKDGFGVGHTPLDRKGFFDWKPVEVAFETVTKNDLIGYEIWRDQ